MDVKDALDAIVELKRKKLRPARSETRRNVQFPNKKRIVSAQYRRKIRRLSFIDERSTGIVAVVRRGFGHWPDGAADAT